MGWQLKGTYFENCNCDFACPCSISFFAQPADNERCMVALFFHVDDGEADGVELDGLTIGVVADTPGQMADGNWRLGVLMDAAASGEQQEKLAAIFGGQAGGPMADLAGMIGENLGVETVPIDFGQSNGSLHAKAGDLVEIELESIVLGEDGEPVRISGLPFPAPTVTGARATKSRIAAFGMDFSNEGTKNAFWAPFSWEG